MKAFPSLADKDYDATWAKADANGDEDMFEPDEAQGGERSEANTGADIDMSMINDAGVIGLLAQF